jgi:hypothetical protein
MEIHRISSLERLMGSLSDLDAMDQNELHHSIHAVASWWRKRCSMVGIKQNLLGKVENLEISINVMSSIKKETQNFVEAQQLLNDPVFGTAFNSFLSTLPRDVSNTTA